MKTINKQHLFIIVMFTLIVSCNENGKTVNNNPVKTLEEYYRLVKKENYPEASQMFSNRGHKLNDAELVKMEKRIKRIAENHKWKQGIREITIIEEVLIGDNKTAFVNYNIVYNNGDEEDIRQGFEKIENKWYMKTMTAYR